MSVVDTGNPSSGEGGAPAGAGEGAIGVASIAADLLELDSVSTVDELLAEIDRLRPTIADAGGAAQHETGVAVLDDLHAAVADGMVRPGEPGEAISYALELGRQTYISPGWVKAGGLRNGLTQWGVHHERVSHPPAHGTTPAGGTVDVAIGSLIKGTTPADYLVRATERELPNRRAEVPGVDAATARAIGWAAAASWANTTQLVRNVADAVITEVRAVGRLAEQALGEARTVRSTGPSTVTASDPRVPRLEALMSATRTNVTALNREIAGKAPSGLGNELQALEHKVATMPVVAGTGTLGLVVGQLHTEVTNIGRQLNKLQAAVQPAEKMATELAPELQNGFLRDLPTVIKTLVDCCDYNTGVSKAIKAGGATPSLLRQLGGVLRKAFEIGLVAAFIDTLIAVFDLPDTIASTVRSAEWVAPYAENAATKVLDWQLLASQVHGG